MFKVDISKITTLEEAIKALEKQQKTIDDNQTYITKLETERNTLNDKLADAVKNESDPSVKQYVYEQRMKTQRETAEKELVAKYGEPVVNAMREDFDNWVNANAKAEESSVHFFKSAFQMLLGGALGTPGHAVIEAFKIPVQQPDVQPKTDEEKIVKQVLPPNPLNPKDNPSATPGATGPEPAAANTDEAYDSFRKRLANIDANPYE